MSSAISLLCLIQQSLTRYGMTIYLTFGNIGLLLNIAIFRQSKHRRETCSLYILCMSVCSLIALNTAVLPAIYALDHPDLRSFSLVLCKLQFYVRHAFAQMMRTFFVLVCADRYSITSNRIHARSFTRYQTTVRVIPSVILFWLVVSILPALARSLIAGGCDIETDLLNIIYSIYTLVTSIIVPIVCATTFLVLVVINLKKIRVRVQPVNSVISNVSLLRKRDQDMIKMLIVELVIYTCTTTPNVLALFYRVVTHNIPTNNECLQLDSFLSYFARSFLLYLSNAVLFWIYLSASYSFRKEFKNLVIKWYASIRQQHI